MARVIATAKRRGSCGALDVSELSMRCLPSDIDNNLHMNNGRYLVLADLGRADLFMRSGLLEVSRKRGWLPLLGGTQSAFLREIRLWREFTLRSCFMTWSGTQLVGRHEFVLTDGRIAAAVHTTGGVFDKQSKQFLPIEGVFGALGFDQAAPIPSEAEARFIASHESLRASGKRYRRIGWT